MVASNKLKRDLLTIFRSLPPRKTSALPRQPRKRDEGGWKITSGRNRFALLTWFIQEMFGGNGSIKVVEGLMSVRGDSEESVGSVPQNEGW